MELTGRAIYALLQSLVSGRVYPQDIPPTVKTYPLIVYRLGDIEWAKCLTGHSDMYWQDVEIAAISEAEATTNGLVDSIFDVLDMQKYPTLTSGITTIEVDAVKILGDGQSIERIEELNKVYWVFECTARIYIKP